jgi:autotransporter-associated beta strand protein
LSGTNIINGPTILEGNGAGAFETAGVGTVLTINGNVSGSGFLGTLFLRGANGSGIVNGTINLPGCNVHKPDTSTWTINSANNVWSVTSFVSGGLRLGAHNALPTGLTLLMGVSGSTAVLDLAGFNQQIANITDTGGTKIITNSSATADSTLTVGSGTYGGVIADSAAGRKTSLTLNGSFTLAGSNPYSGDTTVSAGTLSLSGSGEIPNSTTINLAGGGLDVSTRNDATLTVSATQTLKGNGTLAVNGSLVNNGTIELKASKAGGIVTNDKVALTGNVTLGGTLKLILSGQALTPGDTITVVSASGFLGGAFADIQPAPAPGLIWDTSTVASDGILRIAGTGVPTIGTVALSSSGNAIIFSGTGGVTNGSFSVLTSTNVAAPLTTWITNQTGSFDANGNFSVTNAIVPGTPSKFFSLQVP